MNFLQILYPTTLGTLSLGVDLAISRNMKQWIDFSVLP